MHFPLFTTGPDLDELPNTHRRFLSPRPSNMSSSVNAGTKFFLHDNSQKCRANQQQQQQQQRVLSSFTSSASSAISPNNNVCSSNNDGTIQQTPSILAAATLPRNFSNHGRRILN